jgi:hypothetical protein
MAPSWAEVVGRGGVLPPAGTSNSSPPPAGHSLSPTFALLLNLYRKCKRKGFDSRWRCWRGRRSYISAAEAFLLTAMAAAPAAAAEKTFIAALAAAARPEMAATTALRERSKLAAGERRASARTLVLARRREGSESGTPETLRFAEAELLSLDISLDLVEWDSVFSPIPGNGDVQAEPDLEAEPDLKAEPDLEAEPDMEVEPDVMAGTDSGGLPKEWMVISEPKLEKPACSEKEQRELEADLERISDRLTATLGAACSRKKKRRK